jgi:hypothetical protein
MAAVQTRTSQAARGPWAAESPGCAVKPLPARQISGRASALIKRTLDYLAC